MTCAYFRLSSLPGFLVGWITNYLALLLIFKPLRPTRILGRTWQGLFLRRQREVAAEFARLSKEHFLRGELLWGEIQEGKVSSGGMICVCIRQDLGPYLYFGLGFG